MPEGSPAPQQAPAELLLTGTPEGKTPTSSIAVVVSSGQALFRSGLARLLEEDPRLRVVAISETGARPIEMCLTTRVDVLVTDVELSDLDVLEFIRLTCSTSPATRVLVLGAVADWRVRPIMAAGAAGFLLKNTPPEGLRSAVISVHSGEQVLSPQAALELMNGPPNNHLTPRERAVLQHVANGWSNREIADALHLHEKTVRNYVSRLYRKLPSKSRAQMASFAFGNAGTAPRDGQPRDDGASAPFDRGKSGD